MSKKDSSLENKTTHRQEELGLHRDGTLLPCPAEIMGLMSMVFLIHKVLNIKVACLPPLLPLKMKALTTCTVKPQDWNK